MSSSGPSFHRRGHAGVAFPRLALPIGTRPIVARAGRRVALALVAVAPLLGAVLAARDRAPEARASASARSTPWDSLERALVEAHANCEAAADLELALAGRGRVLLETRELERALAEGPASELSARERDSLLAAARFLGDLARALVTSPAAARLSLDAARLTAEDARFLLAAVHVRLNEQRARRGTVGGFPAHAGGPDAFDARKVRQFRALGFREGLETFGP